MRSLFHRWHVPSRSAFPSDILSFVQQQSIQGRLNLGFGSLRPAFLTLHRAMLKSQSAVLCKTASAICTAGL